MNTGFKLSSKAWTAIISVMVLYFILAVSSGDLLSTLVYGAMGVSVAGVAALDSTHVHLRRYRTWISYGPVGLFTVCALFWPVVIVWYFVVRIRIARGTMPMRA